MRAKLITEQRRDPTPKLITGRRERRHRNTTALNSEKMFRQHVNAVYKASYTVLRDTKQAEEVTREVFQLLPRQLAAKPVSSVFLRPWLLRTATNLSRHKVRSGMRSVALEDDLTRLNFALMPHWKRKIIAVPKKKQARRVLGCQSIWDTVHDTNVKMLNNEGAIIKAPQVKRGEVVMPGGWVTPRPDYVAPEYLINWLGVTTGNEVSRVKKNTDAEEKRYLGVVKEVNDTHVLAEISPRGDADSWEAYLFLTSFRESRPEVNDEFECTLTTRGSANVVDVKLLPPPAPPTTGDYSREEKELLAWAANLHV